ncbi:SAM-dependent methyltransferase [Leptolyngbya sp. 15MV]|nr:SAM-dependent methyltransferase [Leptolyngbya sp. 15MV]
MTDDRAPLGDIFRRLIRNTGPISLAQFMGEANARYYGAKDPLGTTGDFVTAPEVSQMFGELIGLWCADLWIRACGTKPVLYVELGPGRGTLARDALRAGQRYGFEPQVHFVETSDPLRGIQQAAIAQATWHHDLSSVPTTGPVLLIANEFLDALPLRQLVRTPAGWRERMIGLENERFAFVAGMQAMDSAVPPEHRDAPEGTILETSPASAAVVSEVAGRLVRQGGAALFIDYGHAAPRTGSTFQAVATHRKVDPFAAPGSADLTAHVDFATLARVALSRDARHLGTVTQGDWLRSLGIAARADALMERAPRHAAAIAAARDRLVGAGEMGTLFKVMGLAAPDWPDGAGFEAGTDLDGTITGVHRTWLARDGSGKAPIATPRRAMGRLLGNGVRFGDMQDVFAVGEGIETMLALRCILPTLPMIAALSASHLVALVLPLGVRRLYVAQDGDDAGARAVATLTVRAGRAGIEPVALRPRSDDFDDDLRQIGPAELAAWVRVQLAPEDAAHLFTTADQLRTQQSARPAH